MQCPAGKAGSYTIPNRVTSITDWAFYRCSSLTSLTIPNSVTSIGDGAFFECGGLTSVTIGNSVTSMGESAFDSCISLTSITIPSSVTSIRQQAFSLCTSLTAVYCSGDAPSVGMDAFYETQATIYYLPGTLGWGMTFGDRPTAPWALPTPVILDRTVGIRANGFGFRISWATNASVVVEASGNPTYPTWSPVSTNTLTDGWTDFSDPQWANYGTRFYRVRQW